MAYRSQTTRPDFEALQQAAGLRTQQALAKRAKVGAPVVQKLGRGGLLPRNHPLLPRIAAALRVEVSQLLPFCAQSDMDGRQVKRLLKTRKQRAERGTGTALV